MFRQNILEIVLLLLAVLLTGCEGDRIAVEEPESVLDFRAVVDGKEYRPISETEKGCIVFVSSGTDLTNIVAKFGGKVISASVNGVPQESGVTANNFTSYKKGVTYNIQKDDGEVIDYKVVVLDTRLPVVAVTTDNLEKVRNREDWKAAGIKIMDADGRISTWAHTEIRGRGNWTWEKYQKKPYALKLDRPRPILGMPAHRRWVLLALYRGFIGNALAFEATRRAPVLGWAPRGQFVELVLNGKFQGMYYLCEHIKIDENRVDIHPLTVKDETYPAVSGGYLLEYDELYDEKYKFVSSRFSLPVQIKEPNDTLTDAQFNYIKDFINEMEGEIRKIGTGEQSLWTDYMDIDSFADYWMVLETVNNYEAYKPRSVKMFKGRDGVDSAPGTVCKLKAGPLWDQELFLVDHVFNSKNMYYYRYLFKDPQFVETVKRRWPAYRDNILGADGGQSYLEYLDEMVSLIEYSARRDTKLWNNGYFTLDEEVATVREGFVSKINWMDAQIQAL